MRTRTLRTTVLLAVLALTPALASARPWSNSGDSQQRVATVHETGTSFWRALLKRVTAIWGMEGVQISPGG